MSNILVILESRDGQLRKTNSSILGAASTLAKKKSGKVYALLTEKADYDCTAIAKEGADHVLYTNNEKHSADFAANVAANVTKQHDISIILTASTVRGRDITPRVAALLGTSFVGDCIDIDMDNLIFTKPVRGGKALAKIQLETPIKVASLRANFFNPVETENIAEASEVSEDYKPNVVVESIKPQDSARPDVSEAKIVIAGGRGLHGPENWHLIEKVADALPGSGLGASRAVVDAGWRPHSEQVGQTGKTVSPELYIAVGISGAIQHLAGMSSSKVIVAINKDADAPIFKHSTYGLVGDIFEILPELDEALRNK